MAPVALDDRFAGMWVLAATTGMRRSELAGIERDMLDLDRGTLTVENTRVVVDGHATDSDGKTESSRRTISLDPFTIAALRQHVEMIDSEREAFGVRLSDHGKLMVLRGWPPTASGHGDAQIQPPGRPGRSPAIRLTMSGIMRRRSVPSESSQA